MLRVQYKARVERLLGSLSRFLAVEHVEEVERGRAAAKGLHRLQAFSQPRERCYNGWDARREPDGLAIVGLAAVIFRLSIEDRKRGYGRSNHGHRLSIFGCRAEDVKHHRRERALSAELPVQVV